MKILFIDDDAASRAATKAILEQHPQIDRVDTVENADALYCALQKSRPDAVFIDVEMGELSGFDVARYLQRDYPGLPYVFLTGQGAWALKGYEYSPLDFLTKPVSIFRLEKTVEKLAAVIDKSQKASEIDRKIGLMVAQGYEIISLKDVLYVERVDRKVRIFTKQAPPITISESIKNMEQILAGRTFFRCHRSFLIPLDAIESIRAEDGRGTYWVKLRDCAEPIPLSKQIYPDLKAALSKSGMQFS